MTNPIGERFATAIAKKDSDALLDILDPEVDFRALTPYKFWEASAAKDVQDVMFGTWFDAGDHIDSLEGMEVDSVADRERVSYRFRITNADGQFLVEQQAYFGVENDRISWLRIMCSGYRQIDT